MIPAARQPATILIIADDAETRRAVKSIQEPEIRVLEAKTAREGVDLAAARTPDVIVLDLVLADGRGIQVCREIRFWSGAPILVLWAGPSEHDNVELCAAGADDFITKPVGALELTARLRASLRRATEAPRHPRTSPLRIGDLVLDLDARTLRRQRRAVHLTPIEWGLLRTLVTHAGRTLTHAQLLHAIWGDDRERRGQQHLRFHLANLRRKIETSDPQPELIVTEAGVGYRFEMPT